MEKVNCGLTSIQLELNLLCLELWDIGACTNYWGHIFIEIIGTIIVIQSLIH